jgi:arylsulfatase
MPLHGTSMAYTFDAAEEATRKRIQYYEMLGNRAIWADGWTAVAAHQKGTLWEQDRWELYHTDRDFSQAKDLATEQPDRLKKMQQLWTAEARKYNVLPLDDRRYERTADQTRPVAARLQQVYTYYPETSIVHPLAAPQLLGHEHTVTAYANIPEGGAEGVLAAMGGEFGGWTLFLKGGKLHFVHNYLKLKDYELESSAPITAGSHTFGFHFVPKQASEKPTFFTGDVTLLVDGKPLGELKNIKTAGQYSVLTGYGLLIGRNTGTPVSHQYQPPFRFTGELEKVTIETTNTKP